MTGFQEQSSIRNRLITAMSPDDFSLLQSNLEPVSLTLGQIIVEPHKLIEHVYFPENALGSVVAITPKNERVEVAHIGKEGMSGKAVAYGLDRSPNLTLIQVAGPALRVPSRVLLGALDSSASLRDLISRYSYVSMVQISHTALANGRFRINERLARWLLMCHDRLDGDDLAITHEYLALMLGVRRAGVTEAVQIIEGVGIIKAVRGRIRIVDRLALEDLAGECYGVPEAEYARLIGPKADAPSSGVALGKF
jgi:CRP-like cAMP-binding protein